MRLRLFLAALLSCCAVPAAPGQDRPPVSPQRTQCRFPDAKAITIDYFSARAQGREIFGGLVPYGQVWQTGARKPTTFVSDTNLLVGGKSVPAGNYTIFTIPDPDRWTMIIDKRAGKPDMSNPDQSTTLASIDLLVRKIPVPIEDFTIVFDQRRGGCVLNLRWENSEASVLVAETK